MNNKYIIGGIIILAVVVGIYYVSKGYAPSMSAGTQNTQPQVQQQTQTGGTGTSPVAAQNAVTIQSFAFSPATLTVKVGESVTWTNQDSVGHSATSDDGSFKTSVLSQGQSGSVTFSKAGTFTYHCSIHPNMKGTIVVTQ